jgi:hypothetical protein
MPKLVCFDTKHKNIILKIILFVRLIKRGDHSIKIKYLLIDLYTLFKIPEDIYDTMLLN